MSAGSFLYFVVFIVFFVYSNFNPVLADGNTDDRAMKSRLFTILPDCT